MTLVFINKRNSHIHTADPDPEVEADNDEPDLPPAEACPSSSAPLTVTTTYRFPTPSMTAIDLNHLCDTMRYQFEVTCVVMQKVHGEYSSNSADCHPLSYSGPPFSALVVQPGQISPIHVSGDEGAGDAATTVGAGTDGAGSVDRDPMCD